MSSPQHVGDVVDLVRLPTVLDLVVTLLMGLEQVMHAHLWEYVLEGWLPAWLGFLERWTASKEFLVLFFISIKNPITIGRKLLLVVRFWLCPKTEQNLNRTEEN
jgi:hypothetical protein